MSTDVIAWLMDSSIRVSLILALAWALDMAMARRSVRATKWIWNVALSMSLALPLIFLGLPHIEVQSDLMSPHQEQNVSTLLSPSPPGPDIHIQPGGDEEVPTSLSLYTSTLHEVQQPPGRLLGLIIWVLGLSVVLARLVYGLITVSRITERARDLFIKMPDNAPKVLESAEVKSPVTWGLLRPVILVPLGFTEWPDSRRRVVLNHESSHAVERDWLFQILAQGLKALYWFHPLVWLSTHRFLFVREQACDVAVLESGERPSEYAHHLLVLARSMRVPFSVSAVPMIHRSSLEKRLMKILSPNQSRLTAVIAIPVLAAFILSTVGLAGIQIRPMDDDAKQEETTTSSTTIWTTVDDEVGRVSMSIDQKGDAAIDWKEGKIQNISEDGHIDVKASLDDSECQVVVTNDGEGLSFEWTIRGKKKDWNDEGQSWLKQVLLVMGCHQEIGELHGKCGELHGKIGSLHGEEGALQGKIGSIHGRIGSLQGKIGAIQGRVGGLHGQIGGVKSQLNAIRNRPGKGDDRSKRREQELTSRLSALEDELATFDADAKIRSIEGEIAKVQTSEIANIEAEIKALDVAKRVSVIEQRISDLKIDEKVNAIQERLKPLNRELEKKTRKVLNIKNRIII